MKILTEASLRNELKGENLIKIKEFVIEEGTIVTPSAKSFLIDKKIAIVYKQQDSKKISENYININEDVSKNLTSAPSNLPDFKKTSFEGVAGGFYDKKPEHMTHLYGAKLVNKDHPIIAFRGAIDCFEAKIMEVQINALKNYQHTLVEHLQQIIEYVQIILKAEVTKKTLEQINLLDLNSDEIRERSHNPKKYFDINHFMPTYKHGETVIMLNILRTQVRSLEIVAYNAFKDEYGLPKRGDILEALNRLSSIFYIMMFKALKNEYEK